MSILKGLLGATVGFVLGASFVTAIRAATGAVPWDLEVASMGAYLPAVVGWLLGVGVWEYWARGWFGFEVKEYTKTGWKRFFNFDTDHKVIGIQYLVSFLFIFFLAGLFAMVMRLELMNPGRDLLSPSTYNGFMSLHGTMMVFVAVAATVGAFGNYVLPLQIGADDMAFPKLNAVSYWLVPVVVMFLTASFLVGGYDTGWTGYAPLSVVTKTGALFYNMAFLTLGISSIVGALNIITTVHTMRAKGMTWFRIPIFTWSIYVTSWLALIFTQFIALAMLMVALDRTLSMAFFDASAGGDPLLYQNVFWFYSHPAVYIMILPAFGVMLEILSHFSRKPLFAYKWAVGGMIGIAVMSATVWAHHMFTSGMPDVLLKPFLASTELISIPTGFIMLAALGTIWQGKLRLRVPMLFALGVIFNFIFGGITGVFLADAPVDIQLHDTYFVVAHLHYVILGGGIFGLFAAIYYWFPKMTGRMMNETLGKVHFWWMIIGFNLTFMPMFWIGLNGMNRRISDYVPSLGGSNKMVSMAGFFLGTSFVIFLWNFIYSWWRGPKAPSNPWGATTLEWMTSSPPPLENFDVPPEVVGDPYTYGDPSAKHAVLETTS